MSSTIHAKNAIREIGHKAQQITDNPSLTSAVKLAQLKALDVEMRQHTAAIDIAQQANMLMSGGSSLNSFEDSSYGFGGPTFGQKTFGLPPLTPSAEQVEALHHAATSKQNLKVEVASHPVSGVTTKAAFDIDSSIPPTLLPGIVSFRREPTRVASLFPSTAVGSPSFEYIRHTGTTGAAATVAPGGAKPELTLVTSMIVANVRKIAAHIGITDESLLDMGSTGQYIQTELGRAIETAENLQLISGDNAGTNLQGILTTSGVLVRTQAIAPENAIDTLELALNDLRVGGSFTDATGFVMNPADWSAIRLLKTTYGEYLLGHPAEADAAMLWGKPVVVTTQMPAKTVLVGDFAQGGQVYYRQGFTLETQSTGTDWTSNVTRFRAEERLALAIYRPSCFVKVTLL